MDYIPRPEAQEPTPIDPLQAEQLKHRLHMLEVENRFLRDRIADLEFERSYRDDHNR